VALLASAELRETRGFISITVMRPFSGLMANCTFEPPVSTPTSRMIAAAASRIRWYSLSVSVCAGATVIESPVCTPMGSKFSMLQMMTTLSFLSRITSSSNSFQPMTLSSTRISCTGLAASPPLAIASNSSWLYAMLLEHAGFVKVEGQVEAGLSAERRQNGVGLFALDDSLGDLDGERLDVRAIRELGIGHHRCGVRVEEDDLVAFLLERLDRLRT